MGGQSPGRLAHSPNHPGLCWGWVTIVSAELDDLAAGYATSRDPALRESIVEQAGGLVETVARGFLGCGEPLEDLVQEGYVGLIKAIDLYQRDKGAKFATYASHLISGQIKHHLRDRRTLIRQPAWLHELNHKINKAITRLGHKLGRLPTVAEIAEFANLEEESVVEVMRTRSVFYVTSWEAEDNPRWGEPTIDRKKIRELHYRTFRLPIEDRIVLQEALRKLRKIERRVIESIFLRGLSHKETAQRLGVSGNHVSHLQRGALAKLRDLLLRDLAEYADEPPPAPPKPLRGMVLSEPQFNTRLEDEMVRASRYGYQFSLVVVALDTNRAEKAEPGIAAGLREAAAIAMRSELRRVDLIGEGHPEALRLLLPHTASEAVRVCERIRKKVEEAQIGLPARGRNSRHLTISMGLCAFPGDDPGRDSEALLACARQACHAAQTNGGNTVVACPPVGL